jgi:hypothetical protein
MTNSDTTILVIAIVINSASIFFLFRSVFKLKKKIAYLQEMLNEYRD